MRIGRYEALGEIGRGGAGAVFRARTPEGGEVALKILIKVDRGRLARFERERRLLSSFGPEDGFVPLLDAGDSEHGPFLVMPLLAGGTLRTRLMKGRLGVEETVALGAKLAAALARAHERGVVHRDLKPENVLFDASGTPFVADLGLAKHFDSFAPGASASVALSRTGDLRGTPGYLAPEQLRDAKSAGPPADVFALGAILYECLVGGPAFQADSTVELLARIDSLEPEPLAKERPDAPRWLAAIVERALAKSPAARFRDAGEVLRALERRGPASKKAAPLRGLAAFAALLLLAAAAAALALAKPWARAAHAGIEPGREVGAVLLGRATEAEARVAFGDAASIGTDLAVLEPRGGVGVLLHGGHVAELAVRTTELRTRGGAGVGSTEEEVVRELGPATRRAERLLAYEALGVAFELSDARVVERVLVFAPATAAPDLAMTARILVPGQGLDRIVVGRSRLEELQAVFGRDGALVVEGGVSRFTYLRDATGAHLPGRAANAWRPARATIRDGVVLDLSVSVPSSELHLERGAALGARAADVKKELGAADGEVAGAAGTTTWFYDVLGVAVTFGARGDAREITIFPGERPERLLAVPGVGASGVVVEQSSLAEVLRALGKDAKVVRGEEGAATVSQRSGIEWLDRRLPSRVDLNLETVKRVVLGRRAGGLATREGIRIGASRDLIEKTYGKSFGSFRNEDEGVSGEWLYWPDRGIDVHVLDRTNEIDEIWLSSAAKRR